MQLIINGEKIDYSLEKENNYEEVLQGIKNWASSSSLSLKSFQINGQTPQIELSQMSIGKEDVLEVALESRVQKRMEEIGLLGEFFGLLEQALIQGNESLLLELKEEYRHLSPNLPYLLLEENSQEVFRLSKILDQAVLEKTFPPTEEKDKVELLLYVKQLMGRVELYAKEVQDPDRALDIHLQVLRDQWQKLEKIPGYFQTGEDKKALEGIMVLIGSLDGFFRMGALLGEERLQEKKEMIIALKGDLMGIQEAFENQDFVLIGDLVEYEVLPKLKELIKP